MTKFISISLVIFVSCGGQTAASNGGLTDGGDAAGTAGAGASGVAGAAGEPGCDLEPNGTCAPMAGAQCCPVIGDRWLLSPSSDCRLRLPTTYGTVTCVLGTCGIHQEPSCHMRNVSEGIEVVTTTKLWQSSALGPEWYDCPSGWYYEVLKDMPVCEG